jgi:flavin reductase (DIM6/NTAB) family NADH-FMN oxidoreductase RutF/DNA-binding MarR family transcriptional regulator
MAAILCLMRHSGECKMTSAVEKGDPAKNADGFRRALAEFATGVSVITATVDGVHYGLTSNSFSSLSLDPPLVLWSIRKASQSYAAFSACTHFAVNVLTAGQIALSQRFARSGADKFDGVAWFGGRGDAPVINDVAASFECRNIARHDGGDHIILIGEVEHFCRYDCQPLVFARGRYAVASDHPETMVMDSASSALSEAPGEQLLSLLMVRAYSVIAGQLQQGREAAGLGLSLLQARLLKAAHTHPQSTLEELLPELFLDFNSSQHVLESVVAMGLLSVDLNGKVQLTEQGEKRINAIIDHTKANEALLFQDIPEQDLATVQDVLTKIIYGQGRRHRQ